MALTLRAHSVRPNRLSCRFVKLPSGLRSIQVTVPNKKGALCAPFLFGMARPERFELPTAWFVVMHEIANLLFLFNI